jgi:outer membrane lipoprotein-sorting protein
MNRVFAFCIVLAAFAFAQNAKDIIKDVQDKYDEIDNFSASFNQVETFKLTGSKNITSGKIYIKNGEKYYFESDDQKIITDGKTIWTFKGINKQVLIDKLRPGSGALLPRDILFKYPKKYFTTLLGKEKKSGKTIYKLRLDKKNDSDGFIKSIKIWVEDDSWLIKKIETTDINGNSTAFELSNINIKKKLADDMFELKITDDMNVIDMR